MLRVTFIHHSCFMVEMDHTVLMFDYFPGDALEDRMVFHGKLPVFPQDKKMYVFASHRHRDHFHPCIFTWQGNLHPDITYILSNDIKVDRKMLADCGHAGDREFKKRIHRVAPSSHYNIEDLKIDTLRSTDEGVAFVVEAEGLNIYHAGDLHWWNWNGKGEIYCQTIGKEYKKQLAKIKLKHIDIAFVVLDPRMEDGYAFGMEHFIKNIDCDLIFPCHVWQDFELIQKFKRLPGIANLKDKVIDIDGENRIYNIED